MSDEIWRLRRVLATVTRGRGKRYPAEIREAIGRAAEARRRAGESWQNIGGSLGIPHETVRRFATDIADDRGDFVPVEVDARDASAGALVVTTSRGHRVEGLDVESAAELLRRLG